MTVDTTTIRGGDSGLREHQTHLNCPHCNWKNYAYSIIEAEMHKLNFFAFECRNKDCKRIYSIAEIIPPKRKQEDNESGENK